MSHCTSYNKLVVNKVAKNIPGNAIFLQLI